MSKRGELLMTFSRRKFSPDTLLLSADILRDMTEEQKEEKAGQMLTMLNNSEDEDQFVLWLMEFNRAKNL